MEVKNNFLGKFTFNKSKPFIAAPFSEINGKLEPKSLINSKISFSVLLVFGIINISINTHEIHRCPRGEIGRHKGLKILALLGVPVRVWPRAPL